MKSSIASLYAVLKVGSIVLLVFFSHSLHAVQNSLPEMNRAEKIPIQQQLPVNLPKLFVRDIVIEGNRKTKKYIIEREMHIKAGDSLVTQQLRNLLDAARQNVYNTTLFVDVKIEPLMLNANSLDIIVIVKEKWYTYPVPQFQLADRSFNEWVTKYDASLMRVNYGIKFEHYNLTGRKDKLKIFLINGYTRNISAYYSAPYSNPKLTKGFDGGAGYSQSKEISYLTNANNNFNFYKNGSFVKTEWYVNVSYTLRKYIKKREIFSAGYSHVSVADSITGKNFNPRYFNSNSAEQDIVDLAYKLEYTDVNNVLYPLTGFMGGISIRKRGIAFRNGINMFSVDGELNKFISVGNKWFASSQFMMKIKLPFNQPFINQRALGTSDVYLRGLEYYVIDGVAYGLAKFNLKREILNFSVPFIKKSKIYNKIPCKVYAKAFTDFGYAYSREQPATRLNNTFLYTGGIGIDILTLYDLQLRFEYSINQLGEKNLVLHNKAGF
ncbi:MAG: POTRA domain-containing protein [Ginsengibacter sp.]